MISNDFAQKNFDSLISYIVNETNDAFWIRSADYSSQLYVSPNYETKWGFSCEKIYKEENYFQQTVCLEDRRRPLFSQTIKQRRKGLPKAENCLLARLEKPNGEILHIIDHSYVLYPALGEPVIAGIAQILKPEEWQDVWNKTPEALNGMMRTSMHKDILSLLTKHFRITDNKLDSFQTKDVKMEKIIFCIYTNEGPHLLSPREAETLYYMVLGKSTKQIAYMLSVSPRTIEKYIENIKLKLNCRKALELITRIKNIEAVQSWKF